MKSTMSPAEFETMWRGIDTSPEVPKRRLTLTPHPTKQSPTLQQRVNHIARYRAARKAKLQRQNQSQS